MAHEKPGFGVWVRSFERQASSCCCPHLAKRPNNMAALLPRLVRVSPIDALVLPSRNAVRLTASKVAPSCRRYATHSSLGGASKSSSTRRQVTVANDDGHVRWGDLTAGEKVARSTQQSFNFLVVIVGILATVCLNPPSPERL